MKVSNCQEPLVKDQLKDNATFRMVLEHYQNSRGSNHSLKTSGILKFKDFSFVIQPESGAWGFVKRDKQEIENLKQRLETIKTDKKEYRNTQLFVLNTTNKCNLDCIYCSTKSQRNMAKRLDLEVGKKVVDMALESKDRSHIVFHGSEPFLDFDVIKQTVEYGKQREYQSKKKLDFSVQTNLTFLSGEICQFIKKNCIGISTSLDGKDRIHNITRPYKNKKSSYDNAIKGINKVLEFQEGISVVSVVTKYNVRELSDIALDFEGRGITSLQFIPVVPCSNRRDFLPRNTELKENYIKLFNQTVRRLEKGEQRIEIKNLAQYLSSIFFRTPADSCRQCSPGKEHPLLAIDTNGDVYPCDFFFGEKQLVAGNVIKDDLCTIINHPNNLRFRDINKTGCRKCDIKKLCGGGCLADSYYENGKSKPYYCETHKEIYNYLIKKIPELVKKNLISKILNWTFL